MTLLELGARRNCSIQISKDTHMLTALPACYGPMRRHVRHRLTLVRAGSLTNGRQPLTLTEKRALYGNSERAGIKLHHPFVKPEHESDTYFCDEQVAYPSDRYSQIVAHTYMSAVRFPYLTKSRQVVEYGTFCKECNIQMEYQEYSWKQEQERRRQAFQFTSQNEKMERRDMLNRMRKRASRQYTETEEAEEDWSLKCQKNGVGADEYSMTLVEHQKSHAKDKLSSNERKYRAKVKDDIEQTFFSTGL
jgi:hypothetical protein